MIERTVHDDVEALRLSWWRSRAIGYSVHVFLVRGVLIDSGFPAVERDVASLLSRVTRGAMITHLHEDHAGNVALLAERGVPLAIDARTLEYARAPKAIGAYRHFTWKQMRAVRSEPSRLDDPSLEMIATPGHSDDHHVVWDHTTDTLFSGDLFLGVKVRVAHSYEKPLAQLRSLRAMIERKPVRMFCAHRGFIPNPVAMLTAKVKWLEEIIDGVRTLDARGASPNEIRARLLGAREFTHWVSRGDYSADNLVRAILRG